MDEHYHPDVDLDPQGMPCVTLAVPNIEGDVLLCLQMVLGPGSPRIHLSESRADGITFEQAAQWYVNSLSTPLQCVIENMNKKSKIKEDAEALFPETLLGPSGDGGRDREGERRILTTHSVRLKSPMQSSRERESRERSWCVRIYWRTRVRPPRVRLSGPPLQFKRWINATCRQCPGVGLLLLGLCGVGDRAYSIKQIILKFGIYIKDISIFHFQKIIDF